MAKKMADQVKPKTTTTKTQSREPTIQDWMHATIQHGAQPLHWDGSQYVPVNPPDHSIISRYIAPIILAAAGAGGGPGGAATGQGAVGEAGAGEAATGAAEDAASSGLIGRAVKKVIPKTTKGKVAAGAGLAAGGATLASQLKGKNPSAAGATSPTTPSTTSPNLQGAAIMPLFMQSIMQPYLNSIMQQIHQTGQQYGNYMQGMISGKGPTGVALNPAIAQALQAMVPGQQASMDLLGQSGAGSVVAGGALDQLNAQIQKGIQSQQAAQGAYEKNLLLNEYGSGIPGLTGTSIPGLTPAPGATLTNPATNPLAKQIASGGGTITG